MQRASVTDDTIEHMEGNQVPDAVIAMFTEPQEQTECRVWRQYWLVVEVFARCIHRWQYINQPAGFGMMSVPVSLDWIHVERVLAHHREALTLCQDAKITLFEQLEIMEQAALVELNKRYQQ